MRADIERKEIIDLIKQKPYTFAKSVGFKDVKEYPHNEWMKQIIFGKGDYTLMAHRGSFKSSCLSVCIAIIMVLYPDINIIFLRKTDSDISEMINMVRKALSSQCLDNLAFACWRKHLALTENTQSALSTNLYKNASGSSQLLGIGIKSSITGKHAALVITDDICNVADRTSKAERDKTKLQYQELQNIRNRGGRIINLGTKWAKEDVFSLMENIHIYDYKQTGLISDEQIEKIKASMTASLFACNYELKIIADEDVIFTDPQTGADPALVEQGEAHIDAAFYGEDYTAFSIMKKHGDKYYVFGKCWRKHVEDCYKDILLFYQQFMCNKCYLETNADKGMVARDIKNLGIKTFTYAEHMNKYVKIVTYLKAIWRDVIFVQGTDEEFINQICDYNENAEHDDCPDSVASLARILYKKKESNYTPLWN